MTRQTDGAIFDGRTRTLLILPEGILDDVRVLAGKATTTLKLSVSVQIVLRALVEEGLKRDGDRSLLANIESQAQRSAGSGAWAAEDAARTPDQGTHGGSTEAGRGGPGHEDRESEAGDERRTREMR